MASDNILNICCFIDYKLINKTFGESMLEKVIVCFPKYGKGKIEDIYKWAIYNNKIKVFTCLQEHDDVKIFNKKQHSIILACIFNRIRIVELLLKNVNIIPNFKSNLLLQMVCNYGYKDIAEMLLDDERVDPSENSNGALRMACSNGHLELVKLLLHDKRIKKINHDLYIKYARLNAHHDIADYIQTHK